ncbi:DUF2850 domain-containing protein [Vibrio paucivorans]
MAGSASDKRTPKSKKRWLEISVLAAIVVVLGLMFATFGSLYDKISQSFWPPQESVYGTWVEQDVAGYAAQEIIIGAEGIFIQGGVVSTEFVFDGKFLSFTTGEGSFKYEMLNEQYTEMKLATDAYYQPTFRLLEKHKNNLR